LPVVNWLDPVAVFPEGPAGQLLEFTNLHRG
jgi:hypothetical protein